MQTAKTVFDRVVPARSGVAVEVKKGQRLRIIVVRRVEIFAEQLRDRRAILVHDRRHQV